MMSSTDLHKLADVIFGITQKQLHITSSNLVRWYITHKEIFLNLFCNLKRDWSLVPDPFCFWWLCQLKGTWFEKKNFFSKIKKEPGASFYVLAFYVPYSILYQWAKFQFYTLFLSQDTKQNMLLSSFLDS